MNPEMSNVNAVDRINQTWAEMDALLVEHGGVGPLVNGMLAHSFRWEGKNAHDDDVSYYLFEDISGILSQPGRNHRGLHQLSRSKDGVFTVKMTDLFLHEPGGELMVVAQYSSKNGGSGEEPLQTRVEFSTTNFADGETLGLEEGWMLDDIFAALAVVPKEAGKGRG